MTFKWETAGLIAAVALIVAVVPGGARPAQAAPPAVDPSIITNWGSGLCLDVAHDANLNDNGAVIQQWACSGNPRQVWRLSVHTNSVLELRYKIINTATGKCLDVYGGSLAEGAPLQIYHCTTNNPAQIFVRG